MYDVLGLLAKHLILTRRKNINRISATRHIYVFTGVSVQVAMKNYKAVDIVNDQIYLVHGVIKQRRIVVRDENQQLYSIPENYDQKFLLKKKKRRSRFIYLPTALAREVMQSPPSYPFVSTLFYFVTLLAYYASVSCTIDE